MNDRYLFRGKRVDNSEWVVGSLLTFDNEYRIATSCLQGNDENLLDNVCAYKVIPETVGQCTGLKDKNGKLIFEGDIVEMPAYRGGKHKALVYFKNGKFAVDGSNSEAIKEFAQRLKSGVPQETGVIRCADVDSLVKEMTEVEK